MPLTSQIDHKIDKQASCTAKQIFAINISISLVKVQTGSSFFPYFHLQYIVIVFLSSRVSSMCYWPLNESPATRY